MKVRDIATCPWGVSWEGRVERSLTGSGLIVTESSHSRHECVEADGYIDSVGGNGPAGGGGQRWIATGVSRRIAWLWKPVADGLDSAPAGRGRARLAGADCRSQILAGRYYSASLILSAWSLRIAAWPPFRQDDTISHNLLIFLTSILSYTLPNPPDGARLPPVSRFLLTFA